jgi:hypothetical protein
MSTFQLPGFTMNFGPSQPPQRPEARNFFEEIRMRKAEEQGRQADIANYCNQVRDGSSPSQSQPSITINPDAGLTGIQI